MPIQSWIRSQSTVLVSTSRACRGEDSSMYSPEETVVFGDLVVKYAIALPITSVTASFPPFQKTIKNVYVFASSVLISSVLYSAIEVMFTYILRSMVQKWHFPSVGIRHSTLKNLAARLSDLNS